MSWSLLSMNMRPIMAPPGRLVRQHQRQLPLYGQRRYKSILFYPTNSIPNKDMWDIQIHARLYDENSYISHTMNLVDFMPLADKHNFDMAIRLNANDDDDLYRQRERRFLVKGLPRKSMHVNIGGVGGKLPGKSSTTGHLNASLLLREVEIEDGVADDDFTLKITSTTVGEEPKTFEGTSFLLPKKGYTVISSIKDTIHQSHSLDRQRLFSSFFCEEYRAVPDMHILFQKFKDELNASFHFIDLAPWQLYEDIAEFAEKHRFPKASYELMHVKLEDGVVLKRPLFSDKAAKVNRLMKIEKFIKDFPFRRLVLIGNTAGDDPELFGQIFRRYPRRIDRILIRDCTTGVDASLVEAANVREELNINSKKRIDEAMYRVPLDRWQVFFDPTTIVL